MSWTKFDATFAEAAIEAAEAQLERGKTSLMAHAATVVMGNLLLAKLRKAEDRICALEAELDEAMARVRARGEAA